jgi:hypothetical protein
MVPTWAMPALLTRMSRPPKVWWISSNVRTTASGSETSQTWAAASPPFARMASAVAFALSFRSSTMQRAP